MRCMNGSSSHRHVLLIGFKRSLATRLPSSKGVLRMRDCVWCLALALCFAIFNVTKRRGIYFPKGTLTSRQNVQIVIVEGERVEYTGWCLVHPPWTSSRCHDSLRTVMIYGDLAHWSDAVCPCSPELSSRTPNMRTPSISAPCAWILHVLRYLRML